MGNKLTLAELCKISYKSEIVIEDGGLTVLIQYIIMYNYITNIYGSTPRITFAYSTSMSCVRICSCSITRLKTGWQREC